MSTPSIRFRVASRSGLPPYRQLVDQVRDAVYEGRLREGEKLPSVREVVTQVVINPNTVHRAYRELERQGIVEGRAGLGTFVVASSRIGVRLSDGRLLTTVVRELVEDATRVGASRHELVRALEVALDRIDEQADA